VRGSRAEPVGRLVGTWPGCNLGNGRVYIMLAVAFLFSLPKFQSRAIAASERRKEAGVL
jgi:hypothetical protein